MENRVNTSAPGKLMLFGEHAVIYGFPCIVTAVDKRMRVETELNASDEIVVKAPEVGLQRYSKKLVNLGKYDVPKPVRFIEVLINNFFKKNKVNSGLKITTRCDFSSNYGFGSSAAVTVSLAENLYKLFFITASRRELFNICYKTVIDVQGIGSGFDIAAAIYGGTLFFLKGGEAIEPIKDINIPLVVGYTGVKADTPTLVRQVAELRRRRQKDCDRIFLEIEKIVNEARQSIKKRNYQLLGELMNKNQIQLENLGVSSEELDRLIIAAREAGALGAKLSGAGGGDCMLALSDEKRKAKVREAIEGSGGRVLEVRIGAEGVREEVRL